VPPRRRLAVHRSRKLVRLTQISFTPERMLAAIEAAR
jgi:hypothetical protein